VTHWYRWLAGMSYGARLKPFRFVYSRSEGGQGTSTRYTLTEHQYGVKNDIRSNPIQLTGGYDIIRPFPDRKPKWDALRREIGHLRAQIYWRLIPRTWSCRIEKCGTYTWNMRVALEPDRKQSLWYEKFYNVEGDREFFDHRLPELPLIRWPQ